jgi:hypothetical protein
MHDLFRVVDGVSEDLSSSSVTVDSISDARKAVGESMGYSDMTPPPGKKDKLDLEYREFEFLFSTPEGVELVSGNIDIQ